MSLFTCFSILDDCHVFMSRGITLDTMYTLKNSLNVTPPLISPNPREQCFQFKSHSLLSRSPPNIVGFNIKVNHMLAHMHHVVMIVFIVITL